MNVKTYRAKTLQAALELVQKDLGPDAAVLQTKEVWDGWIKGMLGRRQIEVLASRHVQVPSRFAGEHLTTNRRATPFAPANWDHAAGSRPGGPRVPPADHENYRHKFCNDLKGQMGDLDTWIGELRRRDTPELPESHDALFALFTHLVDAEVDEHVARDLIARLQTALPSDQPPCEASLKSHLFQMLEADIHIQGPIEITPGEGRIVALVGPTGVGKTTTIAKLAANFRLRDKCRVGLITVDTYRIAAVEQLRTYADIIDLPMEVVSTPREMREAVARLSHLDLILMDTAGRGPRDEIRLRELKALLEEARADEVHLVLSAAAGSRALSKTAAHFDLVGATALLLTKLDEATGLGNLIPLWRTCHLPLSYTTNGQNVPDDIQPADRGKLARSILRFAA